MNLFNARLSNTSSLYNKTKYSCDHKEMGRHDPHTRRHVYRNDNTQTIESLLQDTESRQSLSKVSSYG